MKKGIILEIGFDALLKRLGIDINSGSVDITSDFDRGTLRIKIKGTESILIGGKVEVLNSVPEGDVFPVKRI